MLAATHCFTFLIWLFEIASGYNIGRIEIFPWRKFKASRMNCAIDQASGVADPDFAADPKLAQTTSFLPWRNVRDLASKGSLLPSAKRTE
jgi:hypothetical protein